MKLLLPLTLLLFTFSCNTKTAVDKSQDITIYSASQQPAVENGQHKPGDVEIYRVVNKDTLYVARFYSKTGELRPYETVIGLSADYTKVNYDWKNDSTIIFTLFNPKTKKQQSFELSGSGANTFFQEIR